MSKKIKIDKENNIIDITIPIKRIKGEAGVQGMPGADGCAGATGAAGLNGTAGIEGKVGSAGENYSKAIEEQVQDNTKTISSSQKVITNNSSNIDTIDSNINTHIEDDTIHFDDGEQKDKVIEHLEQPHGAMMSGGGGGGGGGLWQKKNADLITPIDKGKGIDLNNNEINDVSYIDWNLTNVIEAQEGRMWWNTEDGTLNLGMPSSEVVLQMGQEMIIRARNESGSDILNGQLVYISGASGNKPLIELAKADVEITSATTLAMATEDIDNGNNGYITTSGYVRDIDTNGFNEGALLWLSADTAGEFTETMPIAPNHAVFVGYVMRKHETEGIVYVKIMNGFELSELHDVHILSLKNNDILQWNKNNNRWENYASLTLGENGEAIIYFDGTNLNINMSNPSSAGVIKINDDLHVTGQIIGIRTSILSKIAAYTLTANDDVITCGAGNETFTVDLPEPIIGKVYFIKNVGSGVITLDADTTGSTTIDGDNTQTINQYECLQVIADATQYWAI